MASALFVADQHVTQTCVNHRVVHGKNRTAGVAKHDLNTLELECLEERRSSVHLHVDAPIL